MHEQIVIYGGGGFAREVAWLVQTCNTNEHSFKVECFINDDESAHGSRVNDVPVMGIQDAYSRFPNAKVVGGVGTPEIRQRLMEKSLDIGFGFLTIMHPRIEMSDRVEVGKGVVICAGCILTTNISLGQHVQINLDCTIGHDVILGDYTTLAPGVHVSGCVHFGERVYVGTGAVIINGTLNEPLIIGDDVVIGAGACVTKSIPSGLTVVGVPAKPLLGT